LTSKSRGSSGQVSEPTASTDQKSAGAGLHESFITQGLYLRNWSPRTAHTYRQPELPLEQQRRQPALVRHDEIRRPEPRGQRRLRVVKDRPGRERHLVPAADALPSSRPRDSVGSSMTTSRAHETIGPPALRQVVFARLFAHELPLKFSQIPRKRRSRHAPTLQVVAC
jgi:hypothetical protein